MPSNSAWFNFLIFAAAMTLLLVLSACSSADHLAEAPLCRGTAFPVNSASSATQPAGLEVVK